MKTEGTYVKQWDEIVFQNRNKDYGAYLIRKEYPKHALVGVTTALVFIGVIVIIPIIRNYFTDYDVELLMNSATAAKKLELTPPPPIDKIVPVKLAAPPVISQPVKFLPPKVTTEEVKEEIPTVEEVKKVAVVAQTKEIPAEGVAESSVSGEGDDLNVYDFAEQMPSYIGGQQAMNTFISSTIRYPGSAQKMRLSGTVFVGFIVNADGTISDVHTIKGFFSDCDKEAERVVKAMPLWEPGRQDGKAVKVKFVIPIKFRFGS